MLCHPTVLMYSQTLGPRGDLLENRRHLCYACSGISFLVFAEGRGQDTTLPLTSSSPPLVTTSVTIQNDAYATYSAAGSPGEQPKISDNLPAKPWHLRCGNTCFIYSGICYQVSCFRVGQDNLLSTKPAIFQ